MQKQTMKTYKFDYAFTVDGRTRNSLKTVKGYCAEDSARRLASSVRKKWINPVKVTINNGAIISGDKMTLLNPDIFPLLNKYIEA